MNEQTFAGKDVLVRGDVPVAVVGIGVSGASFESVKLLLSQLPAKTGAAFVIVSESEDAANPVAMVELINSQSGPRAAIALDGDKIEPDHCYVAPADVMTTLIDGHLRLTEPEQDRGERGTVDTFFISLAEEQREAAVVVLLAELEATGSIGLARIRECGGIGLAQTRPREAGRNPRGDGDATGLADMVMPLSEIPARLISHVAHLRELDESREAAILLREGEKRLPAIAAILRTRTGHDFHGYKANTFLRRIQRRMHVVRIDDLDAYVERLRNDAHEVQALFQDLLIGVTRFFRDKAEFAILEQKVIPELLSNRTAEDTLRLWVLGCATGEEAYSLAMAAREAVLKMGDPPPVQIFATDIDARALAVARTGRYPQSIEKDVPPERLARWFVREGGTYCVHRDLREMCIFSAHNVIKDPPFSRIDLISCRNLLIYLNSDLQDRVIPLFHFSLHSGGYLFLGPSENVTRHVKLFEPLDRHHRIFRRLDTPRRVLPEFPLTARADPRRIPGDPPVHVRPVNGVTRSVERLVERYLPAYVVVNGEYEVMNFSGRTGPFLDPSTGAANLNLLTLLHPDLRFDLRMALHRAAADRRAVRLPQLRIGQNGMTRRVSVTVEPIVEGERDLGAFVVLFNDFGLEQKSEAERGVTDPGLLRDEHVQRLESELRVTKERLQATIEELESTNEELKSSNEEYQSINEELQSANEELETSKEELQSVNEELQTVNGELAHRVAELAQANSDIKNLLESTQIATLFLDNQLQVKSFTPSMAEVFHLIDNDLGRPITHIASRVPYPELEEDVRRVLRTLGTIERQIGPTDGPHYLVRVLPYRSVDNFIAGAVLTFLDITETTRAQAALRIAEQRVRLANTAARIAPWDLDVRTGSLTHAGSAEATLRFPPPATMTALLAMVNSDDRDVVARAFDSAMNHGEPLEVEGRIAVNGADEWIRFSGARIGDSLHGVFQNVSDRRRVEAQRSLLLAELQHRVKNILTVVRSIAQQSMQNSATLRDFGERFAGRIDALARTQSVLANRSAEGISLDELLQEELGANGGLNREAVIEGPAILLKDKAAEAFSLAIHELTTNALKYGALSDGDGRLSVTWRVLNTGAVQRLSLDWRESGVRVAEGAADRKGFGRTLIERGLPYDLGATTSLEFLPNGVRCTIELPIGQQVVRMADGAMIQAQTDRPS